MSDEEEEDIPDEKLVLDFIRKKFTNLKNLSLDGLIIQRFMIYEGSMHHNYDHYIW